MTTVYVGSHYEKQGSTVIKYYFFGAQRVAMNKAGVVQYLLGDHLGSTSLVLDASGAKVAESRYYPYGEERWSSGTLPTDYRFTGQLFQASLGIYHMGARFYDPYLARWLSADTIVPNPSNPQSFNRYSWVRNNPLKYIDPTGHREEGECGYNGEACPGDEPPPTPPKKEVITVDSVVPICEVNGRIYYAVPYSNAPYAYPEGTLITVYHLTGPEAHRLERALFKNVMPDASNVVEEMVLEVGEQAIEEVVGHATPVGPIVEAWQISEKKTVGAVYDLVWEAGDSYSRGEVEHSDYRSMQFLTVAFVQRPYVEQPSGNLGPADENIIFTYSPNSGRLSQAVVSPGSAWRAVSQIKEAIEIIIH